MCNILLEPFVKQSCVCVGGGSGAAIDRLLKTLVLAIYKTSHTIDGLGRLFWQYTISKTSYTLYLF